MKRALLLILILLFAVTVAMLCVGCVVKKQSGEIVTETYTVTDADAFVLKNLSMKVSGKGIGPKVQFVSDGGETSVTVTMQKSMFDTVKLTQTGKKIIFSGNKRYVYITDYDVNGVVKNCVLNTIDLSGATTATADDGCLGSDLYIDLSGASRLDGTSVTCNAFNADLSGASKLSLTGISCSAMTVDLSGASSLTASTVTANNIHADISGASHISFTTGSANTMHLDASGASTFGSIDFAVQTTYADVSGASTLSLTCNGGTITGDASGASHIEYKGTATVSVDTSGTSSIRNV